MEVIGLHYIGCLENSSFSRSQGTVGKDDQVQIITKTQGFNEHQKDRTPVSCSGAPLWPYSAFVFPGVFPLMMDYAH